MFDALEVAVDALRTKTVFCSFKDWENLQIFLAGWALLKSSRPNPPVVLTRVFWNRM